MNIRQLRRLHESALRDRDPGKFFADLDQGFESKALRPSDFSIRELMENFIEGGREIVDSWNPRHGAGGGGLPMPQVPQTWGQAGRGVNLIEAGGAYVGTGAFAHISGQIVFNAIMENLPPENNVFSPLVKTIETPFSGERIAGIGRMGDQAGTVEEGQPYPHAGVSEDYIDTPATTKKGMILGVTKEAAFYDRTYILMQRCAEVGNWLQTNKEKRIIDCVIDENVTAHRYVWRGSSPIATYGDNSGSHTWDNLTASNALVDWTDIDNAEQTMAAIVDPNTGEPAIVTPRHLVCTRDLLWTARRIVNATEITVVTPGYATSANPTETRTRNPVENYQIVTSLLLKARMATDTSWFIGDIGKAFAYMQNWPITVVQAPTNAPAEFERDVIMQWKASERGTPATLEPRYMHKSTA